MALVNLFSDSQIWDGSRAIINFCIMILGTVKLQESHTRQ